MNKFSELCIKYTDLEKEFEQYKKESIKWSWEDFVDRATHIGYKCSDEQAQELLEQMIHKHDCTIGITWDTLDYYIQTYCKKKK